jgi:uncharacterized protein HemX
MTDDPVDDRPTMAPFLGALAIIVVLLIGIVAFAIFGGSDDEEQKRVADAAAGQNDALQRADYADFRTFTCRAQYGAEAEVLARQQDSVTKRGERYVDGVSGVAFDGDKATATVVYHFADAPDDRLPTVMTFVREDGSWKVCSTGPS